MPHSKPPFTWPRRAVLILPSGQSETAKQTLQQFRRQGASLIGRDIKLGATQFVSVSQRHLNEKTFSRINHPALLKRRKDTPGFLLGDGISYYFINMIYFLFRYIVAYTDYSNIPVTASLTLHNKTALGSEAASEDIVDLARDTPESLRKLLSPK
jgi:hypothetical protein